MFEEEGRKKIRLTPEQAAIRIRNYCAYQERCHQETRDKLYDYGLHQQDVEQIISQLINENYLNEERFAEAFVSGKFRIKKWGKNKILLGLKSKKISEYCIKKAIQQIDGEEYEKTLLELSRKRWKSVKGEQIYIRQKKVVAWLMSRGYESDLCWYAVKLITEQERPA